MSFIKRFISQKCLGYNADFTLTYFIAEAEFSTGEIRTVYGTAKNEQIVEKWVDYPPKVEIPA